MSNRRLLVIANKWFEADPLMGVLANAAARPPEIQGLGSVVWPRRAQTTLTDIIVRPRMATIVLDWIVEVWCIQDLMNPFLSYSNTAEKARVLPAIIAYGKQPDVVLAFGTAATPGKASSNGCVTSGLRAFLHNPYKDKPNVASNWQVPSLMDRILPSTLPEEFFSTLALNTRVLEEIGRRLLAEIHNPAKQIGFIHNPTGVAVSSVNVVNPADFDWTDSETITAAKAAAAAPIISVETTHGVIRALSDAAFIFVSGITDRVGHFADEDGGSYAQNFVAAHNAAIAASWILPELILTMNRQDGSDATKR